MNLIARKLGVACGIAHVIIFLIGVFYVELSADPQASLIWLFFSAVDFPVSLLYFVIGNGLSHYFDAVGYNILAQIFYAPHLLHGVFGSIWWSILPMLVMPKRLGGVWGTTNAKI